nr:10266_t:CDS:2 [Entrophospora candida]
MLMFYLACPIATSLGKILLQTTPDSISMYLEDYLREANEQIVLKHVYQKLSPLLVNHNNGEKAENIGFQVEPSITRYVVYEDLKL